MDPYHRNREAQEWLEVSLWAAIPKASVKLQLTEERSCRWMPAATRSKSKLICPAPDTCCAEGRRILGHAGKALVLSLYLPDARQNTTCLANRQLFSPWLFCGSVANY